MPALGEGEGLLIAVTTPFALVPLLVWIGLVVWAWHVGKKYPEGSRWRLVWIFPVVTLGAQLLGLGATVILLAGSFSTVADAPAADRSATLARGIAEAMNATAFGLVVSGLLFVASVVAVAVGHARAPRS